jgi:hypothetical protein
VKFAAGLIKDVAGNKLGTGIDGTVVFVSTFTIRITSAV